MSNFKFEYDMPYISNCLKESVRADTVGKWISYYAKEDIVVNGIKLRGGDDLIMPFNMLMYDPE